MITLIRRGDSALESVLLADFWRTHDTLCDTLCGHDTSQNLYVMKVNDAIISNWESCQKSYLCVYFIGTVMHSMYLTHFSCSL
jgi:hypothetical protein